MLIWTAYDRRCGYCSQENPNFHIVSIHNCRPQSIDLNSPEQERNIINEVGAWLEMSWGYAVGHCLHCYNYSIMSVLNETMLVHYDDQDRDEPCFLQEIYDMAVKHIEDSCTHREFMPDRYYTIFPQPKEFFLDNSSIVGWPDKSVQALKSAENLLFLSEKESSESTNYGRDSEEGYAPTILTKCRAALENALKNIEDDEGNIVFSAKKKQPLAHMINHLSKKNLIAKGMEDWAKHIKIVGNTAVHDEK